MRRILAEKGPTAVEFPPLVLHTVVKVQLQYIFFNTANIPIREVGAVWWVLLDGVWLLLYVVVV